MNDEKVKVFQNYISKLNKMLASETDIVNQNQIREEIVNLSSQIDEFTINNPDLDKVNNFAEGIREKGAKHREFRRSMQSSEGGFFKAEPNLFRKKPKFDDWATGSELGHFVGDNENFKKEDFWKNDDGKEMIESSRSRSDHPEPYRTGDVDTRSSKSRAWTKDSLNSPNDFVDPGSRGQSVDFAKKMNSHTGKKAAKRVLKAVGKALPWLAAAGATAELAQGAEPGDLAADMVADPLSDRSPERMAVEEPDTQEGQRKVENPASPEFAKERLRRELMKRRLMNSVNPN